MTWTIRVGMAPTTMVRPSPWRVRVQNLMSSMRRGDVSGNGVPDTGHAGGGGRTQTLTRPMTTITRCGTVWVEPSARPMGFKIRHQSGVIVVVRQHQIIVRGNNGEDNERKPVQVPCVG